MFGLVLSANDVNVSQQAFVAVTVSVETEGRFTKSHGQHCLLVPKGSPEHQTQNTDVVKYHIQEQLTQTVTVLMIASMVALCSCWQ